MHTVNNTSSEQQFWSLRYEEQRTGWDIGYPSTPLKTYIDQLSDKSITILIPGAGNAHEAEYLFKEGFSNVFIMDIAEAPLTAFQKRNPEFPKEKILLENFFEHQGQYDLIFEQTFFCSFPPSEENRTLYAKQMAALIKPHGKLVGLWFDIPLTGDMVKRPFGGTKAGYLNYLTPYFNPLVFEPSTNSIKPRMGNELFGIFRRLS